MDAKKINAIKNVVDIGLRKLKHEAKEIITESLDKVENEINFDTSRNRQEVYLDGENGVNYIEYNSDGEIIVGTDYSDIPFKYITGISAYYIAMAVLDAIDNNYTKVKVTYEGDVKPEVLYVPHLDFSGYKITNIKEWIEDTYAVGVKDLKVCE